MENLIKEKSFKEMIESVGCKFILADIENGLIVFIAKQNHKTISYSRFY